MAEVLPLDTHVDPEAERDLLGCLVIDQLQIEPVSGIIEPGDMHDVRHRLILEAILDMHRDAHPISSVTIAATLAERGWIDKAGGLAYVYGIDQALPDPAAAIKFAEAIRRASVVRGMSQMLARAVAELNRTGDPTSAVDLALGAAKLSDGMLGKVSVQSVRDRVPGMVSRYRHLVESRSEAAGGIRTGFPGVDDCIVGMAPGDFVVVGGRTGTGKSTWADQVAVNAARRGHRVLLVSLEMTLHQTDDRALRRKLGAGISSLRRGTLPLAEVEAAADALKAELWSGGVYVHRPSSRELRKIEADVKALFRERPFELVIIDHLHRIRVPSARGDVRQEVSESAAAMKELALNLDVPVLAPCQLRRLNGGWPTMADLKESGKIEEEADAIILLYRPEDEGSTLKSKTVKVRQGDYGLGVEVEYHFAASNGELTELAKWQA